MKLAIYQPSFRNVLFQDVREEKVGSIFIPERDFILTNEIAFNDSAAERVKFDGAKSTLGVFKVIKAGKDCTEVQPGDRIQIGDARITTVELDGKNYLSIHEGLIIGYERG